MYAGEPHTMPVRVTVAGALALVTLETPKSRSLATTWPLGRRWRKTLPGLMSRWMTPFSWASARVRATSRIAGNTSSGRRVPARWRTVSSESPESSSITRKGAPFSA